MVERRAEQAKCGRKQACCHGFSHEPLCHTITTKAHFPKCLEPLILSVSFWESANSHFPYNFPFTQEELYFEKLIFDRYHQIAFYILAVQKN